MSKSRKSITTTITTLNINNNNNNNNNKNTNSLNDFENSSNLFSQNSITQSPKKRTTAITTVTTSQQQQNNSNMNYFSNFNSQTRKGKLTKTFKEINTNVSQGVMENSFTESEYFKSTKSIPSYYCINVNQDGYRNMDRVCHLNDEEIENKTLEYQLRPISGIRNHIKRNILANNPDIDIVKDTDLIQRIGSVKTLKRLDLSFNNLQSFPRQLCDLLLLETLNLTGNNLTESDITSDWERYQNLIELILDSNKLKRIPKSLIKCKRLSRLSIKNNELIDLKNLEYFKRIKYLFLDYNSINSLDESLVSMDKLEILYLSHNLIQSIQSNLFKTTLNCVKQLDLSFNKLNSIPTELFMLPHLETLNLSNNFLSKLPSIPITYFRTLPIFSLDLSSNSLVRLYDYLLSLAKNIDLSSNRIKTIPSKTIQKLTQKQLNSKTLKLENNPINDPPIEVCNNGIKSLREYFDEEAKKLEINKGFKIIILGEQKSGKTTLSYALEDFNSQSNLIEQFNVNDLDDFESKFVEIHEFLMNIEPDLKESDTQNQKPHQTDFRPGSSNSVISQKSSDFKRLGSSKSTKSINSKKTRANEELNAFSNLEFNINNKVAPISTIFESNQKKTVVSVIVYDFNGNLSQFGHLTDLFLDKTGLIVLCIDSTSFNITNPDSNENFKNNLNTLLDSVLLKMSKNCNFTIIPVLTKIDILSKSSVHSGGNLNLKKLLCQQVEDLIKNHIQKRLDQIRDDLKEIEKLPQISASQSDRLKQLVQTQSHLTPDIYNHCIPVSSFKMDGISQLSIAIKYVVLNNKKNFPDVNKKIPAFWTEVENFALNTLSEMPTTKFIDDRIKIITNTAQPNLSNLCIDYDEYKSKIVEKYGMSHLVEQITKYLNANGKAIWFQETEKMKKKVFLRPNILFEMMFVLFRSNFYENFTDVHKQNLRSKLINNSVNMSEENLKNLSNDFVKKGILSVDLLKIIWFPIMIIDSTQLILEAFNLFSDLFLIGYPSLPKDKLRQIYHPVNDYETNFNDSLYSSFIFNKSNLNFQKPNINYDSVIIPFYLPMISEPNNILKIKTNLLDECQQAINYAQSLAIKKSKSNLLPKISHKYIFPWGLMPGIFEKFSVNCNLNSELCFKTHYKNFIYGYNEENNIGAIIYTNALKTSDESNEVTFEFYLTSYQTVIDGLDPSNKDFDQTLEMDLDQVWLLGLKILQLFEETIFRNYPNLRFDRWSLCPECEKYSFFGEWLTPKELQKSKAKTCPLCEKSIYYAFLVRPSTGQSLNLDMKRMQQRLERLAMLELKQISLNNNNNNNNNNNINTSHVKTDNNDIKPSATNNSILKSRTKSTSSQL